MNPLRLHPPGPPRPPSGSWLDTGSTSQDAAPAAVIAHARSGSDDASTYVSPLNSSAMYFSPEFIANYNRIGNSSQSSTTPRDDSTRRIDSRPVQEYKRMESVQEQTTIVVPANNKEGSTAHAVLVTVQNDANKKSFSVPKCFLVDSSNFFRTCLNKDWIDKATNTISLMETDPDIFARYLEWLYTKRLHVEPYFPGDEEYRGLAKLYVLGEMLQDIYFKNTVIDRFCSIPKNYHGDTELITIAFDGLCEGSLLRTFLLDLEVFYPFTRLDSVDATRAAVEKLPDEYIAELLVRSQAVVHSMADPKTMPCQYHEHDRNRPRKKCWKCSKEDKREETKREEENFVQQRRVKGSLVGRGR